MIESLSSMPEWLVYFAVLGVIVVLTIILVNDDLIKINARIDAAIAGAAEINKRVAFLENRHDKLVAAQHRDFDLVDQGFKKIYEEFLTANKAYLAIRSSRQKRGRDGRFVKS